MTASGAASSAQRVTPVPPQDGLAPRTVPPEDVRTQTEWIADDQIRVVLPEGERLMATLGRAHRSDRDGAPRIEVVVDGWRFDLQVEDERRASLRERARRDHERGSAGGPAEIRAIIPGRVVAVGVTPGDEVAVGDRLFVLEAMKMQNELRAQRSGRVGRVAVAAGQTVEAGDLLLVLE